VRVQFKWQSGDEMTPWIRQITNHASGDRGVYFVPELEDEVYVDFVQGNPDRPYMQGAVYHGKERPQYFDPDNNFKSIKTRSGHTILLNDRDGQESITINDKNGNTIHLDTAASSITISAPENMTLNCKNMDINVGENMNVGVGENMNIGVGKDYGMTAEGAANITGRNAVAIKSSNVVDIDGSKQTNINAEKTRIIGNKKLTALGNEIEAMASKKMDLDGGVTANIKAGTVKVN